MDKKSNRFGVSWYINVGDLVKIHTKVFTAVHDKDEYLYGIVVGDKKTNQITLFPEVDVFLFKDREVRTFTAGSLEIVSNTK